ncbi:MAG: sigma-70 family RNA polymerase sigma factor [Chloroflexia bacterium]|nr:sigma-70 family RNA polymerase sigma factor [Chloroflexia bacterium]
MVDTESEPGSDAELIERARRGDVAAYEELVRRYQQIAFRVAYVIVGSAADAEDVAQEGFVRAYRALGGFRDGALVRPWLLTIVANAARSRRTASARRPTLTLDAAAAFPSDDAAQSPEAAALIGERRRELLNAVNTLRDDDQRVIAYRYFLELSEAETADLLGCARGTVKSRLSRALGRLRQQLERDQDGQTVGEGDRHG